MPVDLVQGVEHVSKSFMDEQNRIASDRVCCNFFYQQNPIWTSWSTSPRGVRLNVIQKSRRRDIVAPSDTLICFFMYGNELHRKFESLVIFPHSQLLGHVSFFIHWYGVGWFEWPLMLFSIHAGSRLDRRYWFRDANEDASLPSERVRFKFLPSWETCTQASFQ